MGLLGAELRHRRVLAVAGLLLACGDDAPPGGDGTSTGSTTSTAPATTVPATSSTSSTGVGSSSGGTSTSTTASSEESSSSGEASTCGDGVSTPGELCLGPDAVTIGAVGDAPSGIAGGDLDGDGHIDLVTANVASNDLTVLWGDGLGDMEVGDRLPAGLQPRGVAIGDLDQNDVFDIAAANLQTDYVGLYLHEEAMPRTFGDQMPTATGLGSRPRAVAIADINDDAIADMVAVSENDESVEVFIGMGAGAFMPRDEYPVGPQPYGLTLADFDGDDHLDIAVAHLGEGSVAVLMADGASGYGAEVRHDAPSLGDEGVRSIATGDFTGDGELDIVVAGFAAQQVATLPGDGEGGFSPYVPFPVGKGPYALAVADMDVDGVPDMVIVNRDTAEVTVLITEDDDQFTEYTYGVVLNPLELVVADFNEDDVPDVAVAGSLASAVSLILSDP